MLLLEGETENLKKVIHGELFILQNVIFKNCTFKKIYAGEMSTHITHREDL